MNKRQILASLNIEDPIEAQNFIIEALITKEKIQTE